jgi:hypothetical protein
VQGAPSNFNLSTQALPSMPSIQAKPMVKGLPPSPFDITPINKVVNTANNLPIVKTPAPIPLAKPSIPVLEKPATSSSVANSATSNVQVVRQVPIESLKEAIKEPIKKAKPSTNINTNKVIEGRQGTYFNANATQVMQNQAVANNTPQTIQNNKNIVMEER